MRKLLSSTHKASSLVEDKQEEEEEEVVKVHAVKPSTLLKYLFKEKHSAKMMEDFIPRSPQVLVTGVVLNDTNGQAALDDADASQKAAAQTDEAPQSKSIEVLKVEVEKQKNEPKKVEDSPVEPQVAQQDDATINKNEIVEIGLTEESVINNEKVLFEESSVVSQTSQEANIGSTQHTSELETENSELKNSTDEMIVEQVSLQSESIEQMQVVTAETAVEAPVAIECQQNTENIVETDTIMDSPVKTIESNVASPLTSAPIEVTVNTSANIDSEVLTIEKIETNVAIEISDQIKEEEFAKTSPIKQIPESQIIIDEKLEESKVEDIAEQIEEAVKPDQVESQVVEAVQQPEESIIQESVEEQKHIESQVEPAITIAHDSVESKIEQVTEEPSANEPKIVDFEEKIEQVNVIQPVETGAEQIVEEQTNFESNEVAQSVITGELQEESRVIEPANTIAQDSVGSKIEQLTDKPPNVLQPVQTATEQVVEEQSNIESKEAEQCEMIEAQSIEVQTENFTDDEEHETELSTRDQVDTTGNTLGT